MSSKMRCLPLSGKHLNYLNPFKSMQPVIQHLPLPEGFREPRVDVLSHCAALCRVLSARPEQAGYKVAACRQHDLQHRFREGKMRTELVRK